MCVILASAGYPESYETGKKISGLYELSNIDDVKVFHSGTCIKNKDILTNGGRVLCVTALGNDLNLSNKKTYSAIEKIHWDGKYYRSDIGFRVMK